MPAVTVDSTTVVGADAIAVDLRTPEAFDAAPGQFVLVQASSTGNEESGYYTISSPYVDGTFEITVAVPPEKSPEESLGNWIAERDVGDTIEIDGPFGSIQYRGGHDVLVFASGPGIGPAVGIGERAASEGHGGTVVYCGAEPPHAERLEALEADGVTVSVTEDIEDAESALHGVDTNHVYAFGFDGFVQDVRDLLESAGRDSSAAAIESFGPA